MYSKAERKFLAPDKDHANPNLGPGCYTCDNPTIMAGKLVGNDGYAPFTSLVPRTSYFDSQIVLGPAPGAYDNSISMYATHRKDPAALFGRSKASRFLKCSTPTPGPGTYRTLPVTTDCAAIPVNRAAKGVFHTFAMTRHPVGVCAEISESCNSKPPEIRTLAESVNTVHASTPKVDLITEQNGLAPQDNSDKANTSPSSKEPKNNVELTFLSEERMEEYSNDRLVEDQVSSLKGPEGKRVSLALRPSNSPESAAQSHGSKRLNGEHSYFKNNGTIVWKRKNVPPSIPTRRYVFGYQENTAGDLVPRKPPKKIVESVPAYLDSFVERAKHESRGYRFTKDSERLNYKPNDTPGPNRYNPLVSDKYLSTKSNGSGPAAMILAPCRRITDEIVADSVKRGIPGPNAYDIKTSIADRIAKPKNRISFGGQELERGYICPEKIRLPGPGAYYPEFSHYQKSHSHKPQPFGSTSKRFDVQNARMAVQAPAVGSYDINEIDSIYQRVQDRCIDISLRPAAFGSITERFVETKRSNVPGPGTYSCMANSSDQLHITHSEPHQATLAEKRKDPTLSKTSKPQGTVRLFLGDIHLPSSKMHAAIFGTQTERFSEYNAELPPPGAYEIATSFNTVKGKGRIETTGVLASHTKRELFEVNKNIPGPGMYNSVSSDQKEVKQQVGAFLSTGPRFVDKYSRVPGPGAYPMDSNNGLLKKTFNITLTEWGNTVKT
ncbi:hypothetical protein BASA61_003043 [Batrachochytrium salamandrivorans]|nr:hypothetical protein BASA61_003043 [Batrachochytrium salamandrivorans]